MMCNVKIKVGKNRVIESKTAQSFPKGKVLQLLAQWAVSSGTLLSTSSGYPLLLRHNGPAPASPGYPLLSGSLSTAQHSSPFFACWLFGYYKRSGCDFNQYMFSNWLYYEGSSPASLGSQVYQT
jgi:hypothetical protein